MRAGSKRFRSTFTSWSLRSRRASASSARRCATRTSKWESVDLIAGAASRIYALYRKPQNLIIDHPDADHDFPDAMRAKAYELFRKHLE
jgi:hypothetical protein